MFHPLLNLYLGLTTSLQDFTLSDSKLVGTLLHLYFWPWHGVVITQLCS